MYGRCPKVMGARHEPLTSGCSESVPSGKCTGTSVRRGENCSRVYPKAAYSGFVVSTAAASQHTFQQHPGSAPAQHPQQQPQQQQQQQRPNGSGQRQPPGPLSVRHHALVDEAETRVAVCLWHFEPEAELEDSE